MRRTIYLTTEERTTLRTLRDRSPKPYLRERAAAILKIADGAIAAQVARNGLLRRHDPDTIYRWLDRFVTEGVAGLSIRAGRGRKPVFPPCLTDDRTDTHHHPAS